MPWSDKSVSPSTYTPVAGEIGLSLDSGLSVISSRIKQSFGAMMGLLYKSNFANRFDVFGAKIACDTQGNMFYSGRGGNGEYNDIWKINLDNPVEPSTANTGYHIAGGGAGAYLGGHSGPDGWWVMSNGSGGIFLTKNWFRTNIVQKNVIRTGFLAFNGNISGGVPSDNNNGTILVPLAVIPEGGTYAHPCVARATNNGDSDFVVIKATNIALTKACVICNIVDAGPGKWICFFGTNTDTYISRSTDDGLTWTDIASFASLKGFMRAYLLPNGNLIWSTGTQELYSSSDNGASWSKITTPQNIFLIWSEFTKITGVLFARGTDGKLYRSTTSGQSWTLFADINFYMACVGRSESEMIIYAPIVSNVSFYRIYTKGVIRAYLPEFQPTSPAKLSEYSPITITLDSAGSNGTVTAYIEHYNAEIGSWSSLTDVSGQRTSLGIVASGSPISLPSFQARAGEKFRLSLDFQSSDGTSPAPAFVSASVPWASDVTAPGTPSFLEMVDSSGQNPGYRVEFGDLPAGSRQIVLEGKKNTGDYAPFSRRAKFESGYGNMAFRGHQSAIEASGERNEKHVDYRTGLEIGDVVQVKIAAVDAVGNQSAFVESSPLELTGVTYRRVAVDDVEELVSQYDEIIEEVS